MRQQIDNVDGFHLKTIGRLVATGKPLCPLYPLVCNDDAEIASLKINQASMLVLLDAPILSVNQSRGLL